MHGTIRIVSRGCFLLRDTIFVAVIICRLFCTQQDQAKLKRRNFLLIELSHPTGARYGPDQSIVHIVYQGKSGDKFAIYTYALPYVQI